MRRPRRLDGATLLALIPISERLQNPVVWLNECLADARAELREEEAPKRGRQIQRRVRYALFRNKRRVGALTIQCVRELVKLAPHQAVARVHGLERIA
jgi:hypothetical protein